MRWIFPENLQTLSDDLSSHGWQLRISIAKEFILDTEKSKNVLEPILDEVFAGCAVTVKYIAPSDADTDKDYRDNHDGTTSPHGTDRDQRGKEVCIYVPNSDQQQLSTAEYRTLLLRLWSKLQQANVPLVCRYMPGDRKITVDNWPSPFSFTSETKR